MRIELEDLEEWAGGAQRELEYDLEHLREKGKQIENGVIVPSVGVFYRIINALGLRVEVVRPIY